MAAAAAMQKVLLLYMLKTPCGVAVQSLKAQVPRMAQAMAVVPLLQRDSQENAVIPPMPIRDQSGKAK